jgi:hypothetical protein
MRIDRGTIAVVALVAVGCAWWALLHDSGPAAPPEFVPAAGDGAREAEAAPAPPDPSADRARSPGDDPDLALLEALDSLLARPAGASSGGTPGAPERRRGFRESGLRILDERSRTEMRETAWKELEPLLAEFRAAGPGLARADLLQRMSIHLKVYLACGGSLEYLDLLAESAENGATPDERQRAVICVHTLWQPQVVDFLEARARSERREVRFYAVEGFAWVSGDERPRAIANLVRGLEDADAGVRGIAAVSLAVVVADPAHVPALVGRLVREEDPRAARAIARSVLELDPAGGAAAVRTAAPGASAETWAAVEEELARLGAGNPGK